MSKFADAALTTVADGCAKNLESESEVCHMIANRSLGRLGSRVCAMLLLSMLALSSAVSADLRLPDPQGLQQIGAGSLRWFGFHVYDASTWSTGSSLPRDGSIPLPFALQIVYARAISAADLTAATEDAWQDLALLDEQAKRWLPQLRQLWPDVKPGDSLVLHIDQHSNAVFYYNGQRLGSIPDPLFGARFAAIWLHPNSSEPDLRQQLLGAGS